MITVFTPSYNRAYCLPRLYISLKTQTYIDFEWLIIDDGSFDDTEQLVREWLQTPMSFIRYYKQENGGKHRAINRAVALAKGDLFFIVDSDDYLPSDSLKQLSYYYEQIKENNSFAGVAGVRCYPNGIKIGTQVSYKVLDIDSVDFQRKLKAKGDMAEAWKTSVLKQYPFPEFDGEKFITEAIVWNKIARRYMLRYFNYNIYICEYLDDGLSKNIRKHHRNSPQGTMLYYTSLMRDSRFRIIRHIKDAINYWRYTIKFSGSRNDLPFGAYIFYPIGYLVYLNDIR